MSIHEEFEKAAKDVTQLKKRPKNDQLLQLYALYKQGSEGDVTGQRPGMLDFKGRAKWDAWNAKKGISKEQAQQDYVDYVRKLESEIGRA